MFDYQLWIKNAVNFSENLRMISPSFKEIKTEISIKPPISETELDKITSKIDKKILAELIKFWLKGSKHCQFSYYLGEPSSEIASHMKSILENEKAIYGGATFINALEISSHLTNCLEWGEETWINEFPQEKKFWLKSIPFIEINNGDMLALSDENNDNPPVFYLSHDDESFIISESFTNFLSDWERLCYLGPETWMLEVFFNEKGYINSDSAKAENLRNILLNQERV